MKINTSVILCSFASISLFPIAANADVEAWYTEWGMGIARHKYPTDLQKAHDEIASISGVNRTQISLDMLGFYFPTDDDNNILGFVINSSADAFNVGGMRYQLSQHTYSLSDQYFFGKEIGSGLFLRGDIGLARLVFSLEGVGVKSINAASEWGAGAVAGFGYGWAISRETRLLFGANYTAKYIERDYFGAVELVVSGLW